MGKTLMMTSHRSALRAATALIAAGMLSTTAHAVTIVGENSLPGGNRINLPSMNYTGVGPIVFDGATWSSNSPTALFGSTAGFVFGNGTINPGSPFMSVNTGKRPGDLYADMFLYFPTLTSGFLAELFWTNGTSSPVSGFFGAYNSSGNLLDYFELNNNGNFNGRGQGYYGFSRPTADIAYIRLSNSFVAARNLTWIGREINPATVGAVPEPATWAFMILGFGLIGGALRFRQQRLRVTAHYS
jgi:hypothetical protein